MDKLEKALGYTFRTKILLITALTHSSYANENKKSGISSNERLEFLGDSILGFLVAAHLYHIEPDMPEGKMTRTRADLVCEKSLETAANTLELGTFLRVGRGEEHSGGRQRPSILADAFEAVLAAVYIDGGIEPVNAIVMWLILPLLSTEDQLFADFKTALQERVQKKNKQTLTYHMVGESGPDHLKEFSIEVRLNGVVKGIGKGKNKKEAEQVAAKAALSEMGE